MHILDQEAPGLSERLRPLSLRGRRRIVANACKTASETIYDLDARVQYLLKLIVSDHALSEAQVAEANSLAEAADERYFDLQAQNRPKNEWIGWFFKARLLTGIAAGFGGESWTDTADALYELSKTRDDASAIFALVDSDISAASEEDVT